MAKIEPHSNGPLFVEIHCLLNTAKATEDQPLPPGMPEYIACGSHYFQSNRYRFMILKRFECDLYSIIKRKRVNVKHVLIIANQVLNILEHFHDKGYAHSDIKAENLMIGSCTYNKEGEVNSRNNQNGTEENVAGSLAASNKNGSRRGTNKINDDFENRPRHSLRPHKKINYAEDDDCTDKGNDDDDEDFFGGGSITAAPKRKRQTEQHVSTKKHSPTKLVTEDHIYLIDFGLALRFIDSSGQHRPFCMDQRRAHDGTLEFTSRDAHLGAHSRRSDLECLGYNMMYWILGNLPWKDEKLQNQPEQVHRMKEIFMIDAGKMLKLIYGQHVPKFLGEYFHYVNSLAYDERPDYEKIRKMFRQEFTKELGLKRTKMTLNVADLKRSCVDIKKAAAENTDDNISDTVKNVRSMAKLYMRLPIKDRLNDSRRSSLGCRVSPKNLRSQSEKLPNKSKSRFSWAEILSQDPDQIARQRAEKEFEREQAAETPIRYKGRPTYAIIEIENRLNANNNDSRSVFEANDYIQGYTKPMMDVVRRRNASFAAALEKEREEQQKLEEETRKQQAKPRRGRRKSDNPTKITVTKGGGKTHNGKVATVVHDNFYIRPKRKNEVYPHQLTPPTTTDESSCSSSSSLEPCEVRDEPVKSQPIGTGKRGTSNTISYRSQQHQQQQQPARNNYPKKNGSTGTSRSSSHTSINSISSEDSVNTAWTTSGISSSEFMLEQEESVIEVVSSDENDESDEELIPIKVKPKQQPKKRGRPPGKYNYY